MTLSLALHRAALSRKSHLSSLGRSHPSPWQGDAQAQAQARMTLIRLPRNSKSDGPREAESLRLARTTLRSPNSKSAVSFCFASLLLSCSAWLFHSIIPKRHAIFTGYSLYAYSCPQRKGFRRTAAAGFREAQLRYHGAATTEAALWQAERQQRTKAHSFLPFNTINHNKATCNSCPKGSKGRRAISFGASSLHQSRRSRRDCTARGSHHRQPQACR